MKQRTFASAAWDKKGKVTRRERFPAEMDAVIPWAPIKAIIEPHYPKAATARSRWGWSGCCGSTSCSSGSTMQQWFNLSDPAAEDALYDSESMRRFAGIELVDEAVPDESTILRFRHLLEQHQLTKRIFGLVRGLLEQKRLLLKSGTIVDATIIEAPPSTKNEAKARDPEMRQTKKGKDWHFGMKAHVGTDLNGLVHTLVTTDAAQSEFKQLPNLLHGEERELYGDQAYWSELHRYAAREHGVGYRVNRRPSPGRPLTLYQRQLNRLRSSTRARGEHAFHVVKHLWSFTKVRYRGLAKNTARLFTAFALANLYLVRRRLIPA